MTLQEILRVLTNAAHIGDNARGELHAAIDDLKTVESVADEVKTESEPTPADPAASPAALPKVGF